MKAGFITIKDAPNAEIHELLSRNVLGTPGRSMVYQHQRVDEKLEHLPDARFVSLELRGRILGTACFCRRKVRVGGGMLTAWYIRYFTFRKAWRSIDRGTPSGNKNIRSRLKKEIHSLLNGHPLDTPEPHFFYAHVDPDNVRSLRLISDFGFVQAGSFRTVFFSRFFPRKDPHVHQLPADEEPLFRKRIEAIYASHDFLNFENVFYNNGYFVYKSRGKIVAGLQAYPEHWRIHELPGPGGKLLLQLISRLPLVNRLFKRNFHFISVEAIFCETGHEIALERLLEDMLSRFNCYTAIMCLDPASPEYHQVKLLRQGWMSRLTSEKEMCIVIKRNGVKKNGFSGPAYVSSFDVM